MRAEFLLLLALVGCVPSADRNVQAVLDTGAAVVAKSHACNEYVRKTKKADIPECNHTKEVEDYNAARMKVTASNIPALQAMEEKVQSERLQAMSLLFGK